MAPRHRNPEKFALLASITRPIAPPVTNEEARSREFSKRNHPIAPRIGAVPTIVGAACMKESRTHGMPRTDARFPHLAPFPTAPARSLSDRAK